MSAVKRSPSRSAARPPSFFLEEGSPAGSPRLRSDEAQHAARVLRLGVGDLLFGLDGQGARFPLRIRALRRSVFELEPAGAVERVPAPGEEDSVLPWIEVAVSWPRRNRVEDMVGRLVQLGAAAIRPLAARQRGPEDPPEGASERLRRVAREACKQAGRAWLPELLPALPPAQLVSTHGTAALAVLDPEGGLPLDTWLRSLRPAPVGVGTRDRPIVLVVGPEGGFAPDEREALLAGGASPTWLGPHVLRVETAAEAAMAIAAVVHGRPGHGRPGHGRPPPSAFTDDPAQEGANPEAPSAREARRSSNPPG